jgi:uncharacterized protein (TIGR02145 family)
MKKLFITSSIICVVLLGILISGCVKDDTKPIFYNPSVTYGNMSDQEGNMYKTVTIGMQTWMAENLRVTHYRNGDPIDNPTGWINLTTGACCGYSKNSKIYGKLYNWYAVDDSRNLCPTGWHVSTNLEWQLLVDYLGDSVAGDKLRETGTAHWEYAPETEATNESGFTALPGGIRSGDQLLFIGAYGHWWSSTEAAVYPEYDSSLIWYTVLGFGWSDALVAGMSGPGKIEGRSVRCVKDK